MNERVCTECGRTSVHTEDMLVCDLHFPSKEEMFNQRRQLAEWIFKGMPK